MSTTSTAKAKKAAAKKAGIIAQEPKRPTLHPASLSSEWVAGAKATSLNGKFEGYTDRLPNIVAKAREGVKTDIFYNFAELLDMPDKFLAELINLSARTLTNYRDQGKTLDPVQGEHLLKLISLFKKGEEILGNLNELRQWLNKPNFKGQKYIDWLITPGGVDLVSEELDRLAEGYSL